MHDAPARRRDSFLPLLALVTLLAAIARIRVAATEPPHFDESYTAVSYVLRTLGDLLTTYDEPNNHVFHNLLAWASTGLFGDGPFALRLPALVAGILLVPATGLLARATVVAATRHDPVAGKASSAIASTSSSADDPSHPAPAAPPANPLGATVAGLVAAAIVAAAPPLIAYSANARGYTVVLLLMVAQLGLSLRLSREVAAPDADSAMAADPAEAQVDAGAPPENGRARALVPWAAWVACGALAVWTVPTAVVGVLVATIWLLALRGGPVRRAVAPLVALAATGAASLALYAPVLGQRGFAVDRFTAAPVKELGTTLAHAWVAGLAGPLIVVAVGLAAVGVARRPRLGSGATLAFGLLALPLTVAAVGRVLPYSRTYLFLLPILAVLAGVGAARVAPWLASRGRLAIVAATAALAAITLAAAAGAQTRDAWGEDPPGPDVHDVVAAYQAARDAAIEAAPGRHPGRPAHAQPQVTSPPFDTPQVRYAFRLAGGIEAAAFEADLSRTVGADFTGIVLTRRGADPSTALQALGLDPSHVVASTIRGDAQAILVVPR